LPTLTLREHATDFIDDAYLTGLLEAGEPDAAQVRDLLAKSLAKEPLRVEETAVRRTLSFDELREQVRALERQGHKRLILVWGEHPAYDAPFIAACVRAVYETRVGRGEIRRVNLNAAPLDPEGYRLVKAPGIGTYQVFQETYHHATYARLHPPHTRKGDSLWRLDALSRAFEALDAVIRELLADGYLPSFCTSCYRLGRTGEVFMEYAIPGFIQEFCTPNALVTLQEYLTDYATPATRAAGERLVSDGVAKLADDALRRQVEDRLRRIRTSAERDLYF
jgi:hypothetical protein